LKKTDKTIKKTITKIHSYRQLLKQKSSQEIDILYDDEKDLERFFHKPEAKADYEYICKLPYIMHSEAPAILLGKNPHTVNWDNVKSYYSTSKFAKEFYKLYSLLCRSISNKDLQHTFNGVAIFKILHIDLINWALKNKIYIPEEYLEAVENFNEIKGTQQTNILIKEKRILKTDESIVKHLKNDLTNNYETDYHQDLKTAFNDYEKENGKVPNPKKLVKYIQEKKLKDPLIYENIVAIKFRKELIILNSSGNRAGRAYDTFCNDIYELRNPK
jgi:hypothetical protein